MIKRFAVALLSYLVVTSFLFGASEPAKDPKKSPKGDQKEEKKPGSFSADTFAGLALRNIGPAVASGRVTDVVVDPGHPATMFVAVASGGVWKTTNAGTTWTPGRVPVWKL